MAVAWGGTGVPLPGYDKQHAADPQVGEEDVHPNVRRQGVEEGEHAGVGPVGLPIQDADPQGHEGLGEVYRFLPNVGDGERSDGQISFLRAAPREGGTEGDKKKALETEAVPSPQGHPQQSHCSYGPKNPPKHSPGVPPSLCHGVHLLCASARARLDLLPRARQRQGPLCPAQAGLAQVTASLQTCDLAVPANAQLSSELHRLAREPGLGSAPLTSSAPKPSR